jgi:polyphosphate kinase 2 (PPK2 family)
MLDPAYPYGERMEKRDYEDQLAALQVELVKFHAWVRDTGQRIAVVFEGRDAAGKGGRSSGCAKTSIRASRVSWRCRNRPTARPRNGISSATSTTCPRAARSGCFDRSWYNRGVVEHVFGFCTPEERAAFFRQLRISSR